MVDKVDKRGILLIGILLLLVLIIGLFSAYNIAGPSITGYSIFKPGNLFSAIKLYISGKAINPAAAPKEISGKATEIAIPKGISGMAASAAADPNGFFIVAGQRAGGSASSQVRLFKTDSTLAGQFAAFGAAGNPSGEVVLTTCDINNDGKDEIIAGQGAGAGNVIRIFDYWVGYPASAVPSQQFAAYGAGTSGGINIACGDVNGDGFNDIIAGQRSGGSASSQVRVFLSANSAFSSTPSQQFAAFGAAGNPSGEVVLAVGDTDSDLKEEIIASQGPGASNIIRIFDYGSSTPSQQFAAYGAGTSGGINIAVHNKYFCIDEDKDGYCGSIFLANVDQDNMLFLDFEDDSTPFIDSSGRGNNAYCNGINCPNIVNRMDGQALSFNDQEPPIQYDYLTINDNDALTLNGDFTIGAWVNISTEIFSNAIIISNLITNTQDYWYMHLANQKLRMWLDDVNDQYNNQYITSNGIIADNKWHYFAITRTGNVLRIYIDGVLDAEKSIYTNILTVNPSYATTINVPLGTLQPFRGGLDRFVIFKRALTLNEINLIFKLDCNDFDKTTYPDAPELCGNDVDNNCDGRIDEYCADKCSWAFVRCANNQPMRCGIKSDGSIGYFKEGPSCNLEGKKCYATTIKPSPGIGFEKGIGKVGCIGETLIDSDGRTVFNEFGSIRFAEGSNVNANTYAECVQIFDGHIKTNRQLCPNLKLPMEVSLFIPIENGKKNDLSNFKIKHDSDGDGIFEAEYDNYTARVYNGQIVVELTARENPIVFGGGNSITDCGDAMGIPGCIVSCYNPGAGCDAPYDSEWSTVECEATLNPCRRDTKVYCKTIESVQYEAINGLCRDVRRGVLFSKRNCRACCATTGRKCDYGCTEGKGCNIAPNTPDDGEYLTYDCRVLGITKDSKTCGYDKGYDTITICPCDPQSEYRYCNIDLANIDLTKKSVGGGKSKCVKCNPFDAKKPCPEEQSQSGAANARNAITGKTTHESDDQCQETCQKCGEGQVEHNGYCCSSTFGTDKCLCCDGATGGQVPMGMFCTHPNCGDPTNEIPAWGCGTSCPSACYGGYYYGGGSVPCS